MVFALRGRQVPAVNGLTEVLVQSRGRERSAWLRRIFLYFRYSIGYTCFSVLLSVIMPLVIMKYWLLKCFTDLWRKPVFQCFRHIGLKLRHFSTIILIWKFTLGIPVYDHGVHLCCRWDRWLSFHLHPQLKSTCGTKHWYLTVSPIYKNLLFS